MATLTYDDTLECNLEISNSASLILDRLLDGLWNPNQTSPLLEVLLRDPHDRFRTAFANFLHCFFKEIGTADELTQHEQDCKTRDEEYRRQIQDGDLTHAEANREIVRALCWTATRELEFEEHLDAMLASKLREFVDIRRILASCT